ncbi:MFS transporter [Paraferrimonas sp. SM1919]|uniref:MFS transporter n=1 Tax=Paraferrimonas sp. SM1919 TaxID=2662263 RepID=UPI0013D8020C|nr:MFS transporter [Paraferrimonas sp. SM1919]
MNTYQSSNKNLITAAIMSAVGSLFFLMMPTILAMLGEHFKLSLELQGYTASAYFLGFLVAGLCQNKIEQLLALKQQALISFSFVLMALLLLSYISEPALLLLNLILLGIASGSLFSLAISIISFADDPDRWFGIKVTAEQILSAILLFSLPLLVTGFVSLIYLLFVACIICAFSIFLLPKQKLQNHEAASSFKLSDINIAFKVGVIAIIIKFAGLSGLWAFIETMGGELAPSPEVFGQSIGISLLGGLVGGLIAAIKASKFGHKIPLIFGNLLLLAIIYSYSLELNFELFIGITFGLSFLWNYTIAYELSLVAKHDPNNKYVSLMAPAIAIGAIIGPGIAGNLISISSVTLLLSCAVSTLVATIMFLKTDN